MGGLTIRSSSCVAHSHESYRRADFWPPVIFPISICPGDSPRPGSFRRPCFWRGRFLHDFLPGQDFFLEHKQKETAAYPHIGPVGVKRGQGTNLNFGITINATQPILSEAHSRSPLARLQGGWLWPYSAKNSSSNSLNSRRNCEIRPSDKLYFAAASVVVIPKAKSIAIFRCRSLSVARNSGTSIRNET